MNHNIEAVAKKNEASDEVNAGSFAHAHDFVLVSPVMNDITKIETQNIYNYPKEESPPLSPLRTNIPSTSRNFVGQERYLEKLHQYFSLDDSTGKKIFVLYGMGGIGKTQICLKFMEESEGRFLHIFWIDATSEDTIALSLKEAYKKISPPETAASSFSTGVVLNKISGIESDWLMIYDNADGDPQLVENFLPPGKKGNILITSRNPLSRRLTSHENSVQVTEMSNESAVELILRTSGVYSYETREAAQKIVNALNHHPLALDMAGAYILQTDCHIEGFMELYSKYGPKILNSDRLRGAPKSAYNMWEMSFETLLKMAETERADTAKYAMTLVNISAYLHHENISYDMFKRAAIHYNEQKIQSNDLPTYLTTIDKSILNLNEEGEWDEHLFNESISLLQSLSLIKTMSSSKTYSMHSLLQPYCQDRMSVEEKEIWMLNAMALIAASVSEKSTDKYTYQNNLPPHLLIILDNNKNGIHVKYYDDLQKISAKILHTSGLYKIEETLRLNIVNAHLHRNDEVNDDIAGSLEKMCTLYLNSDQPLPMLKQLMAAIDSTLDLSICYHCQSKSKKAEPLQTMVLSMREIIMGNDHPATLNVMSSLASTYQGQGKLREAEQLQTRLLGIQEMILGKKHPGTLRIMTNLATIYQRQGKLTEAGRLLIDVLGMQEKILGKDHPETLRAMAFLALNYRNQGKLKEAEQLQIKILTSRERIYGTEHRETLVAMNNLAFTYQHQGRLTQAEQLQYKLLNTEERILGKEHPETLSVMNRLGLTYKDQGKFAEAEQLQIKLLGIHKRIHGEEHLDALTVMNNLALTYRGLKKFSEAEKMQNNLLHLQEKILGKEHPDTLRTMYNLAGTYQSQCRWKDAEQLQTKVLGMQERILGNEHPETMRVMNNLALSYRNLKKITEAEQLQIKVLSMREKILGKEHPETMRIMYNLAVTKQVQDKWTEAEQLQIKTFDMQKRILGEKNPDTVRSKNNLKKIYEKLGKMEEATALSP